MNFLQKKKVLILVDYSWCLHRYLAVFRNLSVTINGEVIPTGAFFGFCYFLESVYKRFHNTELKVIFCKDDKSKDRLTELPEYKGQRNHSSNLHDNDNAIGEIVCALDFVHFCEAKNQEADDVMALYALRHKDQFDEVIIYSGDNDMLQLMSEGIRVTREFNKHGFVFVDQQYINVKFGNVEPKHLPYMRALLGDVSDNIPTPVSGLRKDFLVEFVKIWEANDLSVALNDSYYMGMKIPRVNIPEQLRRLNMCVSEIIRNYRLMSLLKYKQTQYYFPINEYRIIPNESLINLYQLDKFKLLLEYIGVIKSHASSIKAGETST